MLPPRGLLHPILPYHTQGKLMFSLCKTCADTCNQQRCTHDDEARALQGTWCHVELNKALEKGYRILRMHEVWHFPQQSNELFSEYIDTFLKVKQEASDYPIDCVTEEQRQRYVNDYYEREGVLLERDKIEKNPGLRALAKLMLNSFWGKSIGRPRQRSWNSVLTLFLRFVGKFAQRSNLVQTKTITDVQTYLDYFSSDEFVVLDAVFVNEEMVELRYENTKNFIETNCKTNMVIAAFTTAYARLRLYETLEVLQERVLYYDTDSVIFISKPGEPEPSTGRYLGELTDELNGGHITTFISGGPKNYCYRTNNGKVEIKVRGITLNCDALQKINLSSVRALVYLHAECAVTGRITIDIPFKITRNTRTKEIETKRMKKDYRIVYDKRVIMEDYKTLPYGY